jgi:adenylate cyclase
MKYEIERKFLIDTNRLITDYGWHLNDPGRHPQGVDMTQGYIALEPNVVRIRIEKDPGGLLSGPSEKAWLAIKGKGLIKRPEYQYQVPLQQGIELLTLCQHKVVKVRYKVYNGQKPVGGSRTWEIDQFKAEHDGLWLAEIELDSEDEEFEKPPWLGAEVTNDARYQNVYLASHAGRFWDPT